MKVQEAIKHLQDNYELDQEICLIIWGAEDVTIRAEDLGVEVAPELVDEIIASIERSHDATIGVTWDTIDAAIFDQGVIPDY